ncbi:hypothetical protein D3C71_2182670 [compost metagenome]
MMVNHFSYSYLFNICGALLTFIVVNENYAFYFCCYRLNYARCFKAKTIECKFSFAVRST